MKGEKDMKEIKMRDILDIKYIEKDFPQALKNPYFLDKKVSFVGEHLDKYDGTEYKTFYFVSIGNGFYQQGKPARMGVTLRYNFDI
jgi:hypothetical protein